MVYVIYLFWTCSPNIFLPETPLGLQVDFFYYTRCSYVTTREGKQFLSPLYNELTNEKVLTNRRNFNHVRIKSVGNIDH